MVYLFVDGTPYGLFDVATSFEMERLLRQDFPDAEIEVQEAEGL